MNAYTEYLKATKAIARSPHGGNAKARRTRARLRQRYHQAVSRWKSLPEWRKHICITRAGA